MSEARREHIYPKGTSFGAQWAWGPHPCGPQPQTDVTPHVGRIVFVIKWDSSGSNRS